MKLDLTQEESRLLLRLLTKEKKVLNEKHFLDSWYDREIGLVISIQKKLQK